MNTGDLITRAGVSYPEQTAFVDGDVRRSYGDALRRVDSLCRALVRLGVRAGDRVALYLRNCPEYLETMFAVWKVGAVAVPLNASFTGDELGWHLQDAGAVGILVDGPGARVLATVSRQTSLAWALLQGDPEDVAEDVAQLQEQLALLALAECVADAGAPYPSARVADQDLAWLAYTSGTTGRPKGAMLSHGCLVAQCLSTLADVMRLERRHVGMHAAPLSHASGHNALAFTMKACTQVFHRRQGFDAALFLDQVQQHGVAATFLVPTQLNLVVQEAAARPGRDVSSLRWLVYGGSPLYRQQQRRALEVLGPCLVQIFGQTESPMCGTVLPPEEHSLDDAREPAQSVGRARAGVEVRILDDHDRAVPAGTAGQVCLRGPTLMNGYWNRPDATAAALASGWLHTGDIGVLDEAGYLYLRDRLHDLVITGGMNVYPREVEDVLEKHPAVAEVCVIGVPDEKWGEAVRAVVVLNEGTAADEAELIAFAGRTLAGYKKPKAVDFVAALPRTSYGKIAKAEVRKSYWAHLDRRI